MKTQIGEVLMTDKNGKPTIHPNKTRKYLLPCLKEYGVEFTRRLENVMKVAVGIGDFVISNRKIKEYERHLFVLIDTSLAPKYFRDFIEWVRDHPVYEDDYVYGNVAKSKFHMVVIKFPEKYYESFEIFQSGRYSQMYSEETIEKFFNRYPERNVLIKDHNYKIVFVGKLNKIFNSTIKPEEYEGELDLPPSEREEKFNHHLKRK